MDQPQIHRASGSPPGAAQVSILEILATIVRGWRAVVVLPIVLALLVGITTYMQDRTYAATATFMTQGSDTRAAGGAAALAQQFGISLGGNRPGDTPQFYLDLLRTRAVLRATVETEYEFRDTEGRLRRANLIEVYGAREDPRLPPPWDQAAESLRRGLATSVTGTGLVHLTVPAPHPELAEQVTARLLELLDGFNGEVQRNRAYEEGRFLADRVSDAQADLAAAEDRLGAFLRQNRMFEQSPDLLFEHGRLQRQVAIHQDVYTSLLRAREQNRIDVLRDTPLLAVVDPPLGSARPQPRGTITRALMAFMLGLTLAILGAFIVEYVRRTRANGDPHYRELEGAARKAWEDFRHPARWVGRDRDKVAAGDR
jgi:uncharacterized protein involved in exopolysaccharide biosynthesis